MQFELYQAAKIVISTHRLAQVANIEEVCVYAFAERRLLVTILLDILAELDDLFLVVVVDAVEVFVREIGMQFIGKLGLFQFFPQSE